MSGYIDDYDIIKECLYGDKEVFSQLVDKYKETIFNFVLRMTGNYHEAEDITMEAFIQAYKKLKDFKFGYKFKNWIFTIAANISRDKLRRKNIVHMISLNRFIGRDDKDRVHGEIPDPARGPEEILSNNESARRIRKIIDSLSTKYREIFLLRYIEDFSYGEISRITGLPLGTVETRLFRAKKILLKNRTVFEKE